MKKLIIIVCVFLLIVIVTGIILFAPVKFALKQSDLKEINEPYYLVKWVQVTGASWMIVGDQNGYYEQPIYVIAEGETPSIVKNYSIATGDNIYLCYGNYIGKETILDGEEMLEKYNFTGWDILYPIRRNGLLPFMPERYLCKLDF